MGQQIGAILPLSVRGSYDVDDLNRADLLFATITGFADPGLFSPFLVVTPPHEVEIVKQHFAKWTEIDIQVISEEELVPEFKSHGYVRGWRKQQIIKLAAPRLIDREFFITFDADVICLRPLSWDDMVIDGRALIQLGRRSGHKKWWASSGRILKINPKHEDDPEMGMYVTPAILSTKACRELTDNLTITGKGTWADQLCSLHAPFSFRSFRLRFQLMRKWTEYTLYYLYAANNGLLTKYHVPASTDQTPQNLITFEPTKNYAEWDTAKTFSPECPSIFAVVGSKSRVHPKDVWQKIRHHIPQEKLASVFED